MKTKVMSFVAVVSALVLAGCTNVATFDYSAAPGTMMRFQEAGVATKSVAVLPVMDQRGARYLAQTHVAQEGDRGSFYWGFLPFFPFGWVEKEEPENSNLFVTLGRFHFSPQNDLANAAYQSLVTSNLFARVTRANTLEQADADYIWRSRVTSTYYCGCMYSYCISYFFVAPLWIIGFPCGSSRNELCMTFELVERATGNVVWSYDYRGSDYIVHWIYARIGKDTSLYARLMKQAMNGALVSLSQRMPTLAK